MEQLIEAIVNQEHRSPKDESNPAVIENIYFDHANDEESPNTDTARRRNRTPNPNTWKRKRNALLRERGQSYYGIKTVVDEEGRKWCTEVPRNGRRMKARCECKSTAFECKKVDDEMRQRLFDEFWAFSWEEKRAYMCQLVVPGNVMRPRNRKDASYSRRSRSLKYYFEVDGKQYRVCKTMFLNTFDLSQWSVHGWPKKWATADVDCLLDESVAATSSWFEEFMARLPKEKDTGSNPKKRKSSSPSTDSSKVDVTEEWISESEYENENEQVESSILSFANVSAMKYNSDDENVNSVRDRAKYRECETSTTSVDLTSQQSDLHQMLLDMSRRMDDMQEKFDKRLQSLESQLSKSSQNKNQETATTDSKFSVSSERGVSNEEQEADSLTESQAYAGSDDESSKIRTRSIISQITDHIRDCDLAACETCRELRRISRNIKTKRPPARIPMRGTRSRRGRPSSTVTSEAVKCQYCFRNYENRLQLAYHLERHTWDDFRSCCHCLNE